jgi:hypothetical protein
MHLSEAKERLLRTKGKTWPKWVLENCSIGWRRADTYIDLVEGRTSLAEAREKNAANRFA